MAQLDTLLDPQTGDLPDVSSFVTGIALIEQRIRLRLQRGLREWFLDQTVGLPLIEWREQKPPQVTAITSRVQQEIARIPGVTATQGFEGVHDGPARKLTITGNVLVDDGSVTAVVVQAPTDVPRNTAYFAVFFASGNVAGGVARPTHRGL